MATVALVWRWGCRKSLAEKERRSVPVWLMPEVRHVTAFAESEAEFAAVGLTKPAVQNDPLG